jgi:predicted secreted protein
LSKKEYDNFEYRQLCSQLANDVVKEMLVYKKENYKIIGLIGIEDSQTSDSKKNEGIFMEELFLEINKNKLKVPTFDISENYKESEKFKIKDEFEIFLNS